ncbi:glycosyltransferase family 2 protein [Pseudoalteromonas sp. MMG013]|uniref:glycosyltransferase n=1 Tax=Pseudoalteromonas sp. MMG013 TaxID=2822687 RepID=UPI001B36ED57|nr:glycosyltransferase family 2 protein [Pseudoalteromonas sp. MMG013]MBQ4863505.1 glycosyltransferase family 2 protein [Pseudoalteromonas sp. MMG013]
MSYSLSWLHQNTQANKTAILVPFFNEAGNATHFKQRLAYFDALAGSLPAEIDIILIDDGSSDNPQQYVSAHYQRLSVASVSPNGQKIGALQRTIEALDHEYIIFTDFDTELENLAQLTHTYSKLAADENCMGCYFKMMPIANSKPVVQFQLLEYALERAAYHFNANEGSVPIMPGAGCLYKRPIIEALLARHSGLRSGEDRETCLLGIEQGYTVFYEAEVVAMTAPPQSFWALYQQRVRWSRGFIEVAINKSDFYGQQMRKKTVLGRRHLLDIISVSTFLIAPLLLLFLFLLNETVGWGFLGVWSLIGIIETYAVYRVAKQEFKQLPQHRWQLVLMPFARLLLEVPTWWSVSSAMIWQKLRSRSTV